MNVELMNEMLYIGFTLKNIIVVTYVVNELFEMWLDIYKLQVP